MSLSVIRRRSHKKNESQKCSSWDMYAHNCLTMGLCPECDRASSLEKNTVSFLFWFAATSLLPLCCPSELLISILQTRQQSAICGWLCCWMGALMTHAQLFVHLYYLSRHPQIYYICRRRGTHSSPIYYFLLFLFTSWKIKQMKGIHPGTHRNFVFML